MNKKIISIVMSMLILVIITGNSLNISANNEIEPEYETGLIEESIEEFNDNLGEDAVIDMSNIEPLVVLPSSFDITNSTYGLS